VPPPSHTTESTYDNSSSPQPSITERLKNATECGRKGGTGPYLHKEDQDPKIVGGVPAVENEFPWQVAVMTTNNTWRGCGAILLSCDPIIVISAAHCFPKNNSDPSEILLAFGAHTLGVNVTAPLDVNEVRLPVEEVIIHPSYNILTLHIGISVRSNLNLNVWENDIAILKVKNGSKLECKKKSIWPACLPNKDFEYGGWERSVVSGWGRVVDGGAPALTLRKARIPIVTDQQCIKNINQIYPEAENITQVFPNFFDIAESKICAGDIENGIGICEGDSGGPLATQDLAGQGWSAVGVVSYRPIFEDESEGCGGSLYGVFTEIAKYLDWIAGHFDLLQPT